VFFTILSFYQHEGRGDPTMLNIAFVIYLIALFTDFLDGYLARRWKVEGAFGRVVDPFVDKVLVIGSFIFFAGKNFIIPETAPHGGPHEVVKTISGVVPFMVVVILARELLVTSFRGLGESTGHAFGAAFSGKVKMVVQSVTILVILLYVNYFDRFEKGHAAEQYARVVRDVCIWITIVVTVWSGLLYIQRARTIYNA
jgi:CDP-diacylglycerol--glycerol-3-phosphate 3-phosphatidyltransferase